MPMVLLMVAEASVVPARPGISASFARKASTSALLIAAMDWVLPRFCGQLS